MTLSLASHGIAATQFWTQSFAPGEDQYRPGTAGTRLHAPDTSVVNYNTTSPTTSELFRPTHGEGIFDGAGTERLSGRGFFINESVAQGSQSGTMSAVFSQNYNIAAQGDTLRMSQAFAWGHMSRSGTGWTEDNQVLQFGVMNLGGGSSDNQYFANGGSNSLYVSFVATSAQARLFNSAVTDPPGSHTGDLTLRNENGIIATLASGITFDSNDFLGGNIGAGDFTTQQYWYDFNLDLTRGADNALTVNLEIEQYTNLSDIDWSTQSANANGLTTENLNFLTTSVTLDSTQHGLGDLDSIDLNPAIGVNLVDSLNSGASGLVFDANTLTTIPEPSVFFAAFLGAGGFICVRRRKSMAQ